MKELLPLSVRVQERKNKRKLAKDYIKFAKAIKPDYREEEKIWD